MGPKKIQISGVIIVKNEEKNIGECLKSIKDVVDEIIVVDSYSIDKTIDIVKKYTDRIFLKEFQDDFSLQRNFALQKSSGNWILTLDADERLSQELKKEIPKLIISKEYQGYFFSRRNYIDSKRWLKHGIFYPDYQLRLFRKGIKYVGMIHERPDLDEKFTKKISLDIIHNSSHTKFDKFSSVRRLEQFIRIHSQEILGKKENFLIYPLTGLFKFYKLFLDSFILGKGFLDGWVGFRAALIFSTSIGAAYIFSFLGNIKKQWKK